MTATDTARYLRELREQGAVVLRGVFQKDFLTGLRGSAEACFKAIEAGETRAMSERYGFTPFSYSVILAALLEFGAGSPEELARAFSADGWGDLLPEAIGGRVALSLENSWVRKRFAPGNEPRQYHPNSWHQDGGLGVTYGSDPASPRTMRRLLTCWAPLSACGRDCPNLEFVRERLTDLLHYTELDDVRLRGRFAPDRFWAPELEFGDGLLFLPGTLHRTGVRPEMKLNRLSVEYRFFPG